ncbi:MAG TPA: translocation/assembly module TamB domain-containing protein [Pyrinomonadaceae bacterium]|nr:translocation/assembly module TamB domain-containing protein [Pyrinomonadaceae bacterium]
MPVDDRDEQSPSSSPGEKKKEVQAALQSETDRPLPPAAEAAAERDADRPEPKTPQGRRRRFLTRRNALFATLAIAVAFVLLVLAIVIAYRLGYIDRYIANQVKSTLSQYGIRAEIKHFETRFGPRTVEMREIELYDQTTGEKLGKIDRILAAVRIDDLYSISLRRDVKLQDLQVDGLELWVKFDEAGNSNWRNLHLPPPDPNARILFSYSTANIHLNNAVVHYGDERYDISGEARNIVATIAPDDPNAPEESRMNRVTFSSTASTFVYNGRPVNPVDITARGRLNQTRAEIEELVLRSPVAEAHLSGVMDDWRNLRYRMNVNSTVDLTQASDILQTGATLRGASQITGTVTGEGSRYQIDGEVRADGIAADGVRLQALRVTGQGRGEGKSYEVNGRAVAELLAAGDFQLNAVQLTGKVMGTGTDFRWLGDLRAGAARHPSGSVTGLIVSDATAESRDEVLTYSAASVQVGRLLAQDASFNNLQATGVRGRTENNVTTASVASVRTGTITSTGARVDGLAANNLSIVSRGNVTNVETDSLRVGGVVASGAKVGSLNIAGVRLSIYESGRYEGTSGDINAGTVTLTASKDFPGGRVDNVRLGRPAFVVEPSGRYRLSGDLSLGGGVLGQINLGSARAALVATNSEVRLDNFDANIMGGRATGDATVSTVRRGQSHVDAQFSDLDIGSLIATLTARPILITGKATGTANLSFPETNLGAANGTARLEINAETGNDATGRTPVNGEVALRATNGLFEIERANLRTPASELNAAGRFSVDRDESNLQLHLASSDAAELQRLLLSTGLFNEVDDWLQKGNVELAGKLAFDGTVRGRLKEPSVEGRASLDSLLMNGRDLGSLSAQISSTPDEVRVTDGRLTERDGGGVQFALTVPLKEGAGSASVDATLERADAGTLAAALSALNPQLAQLGEIRSDLSGTINIRGIPSAMSGNADLRFSRGSIGGEPFESITALATFQGSIVNLNSVVAQLDAGRVTAHGTYDTNNRAVDIQAEAVGIQIERLAAFAPKAGGIPNITGTADLNASIKGVLTEEDFSNFNVTFDGAGRDVKINGRAAGPLTLTGRTENRQLNISFTTGLLGSQQQVVAARVDLGTKNLRTTVETTLTNADLTQLLTIILNNPDVRVTGRATGTLRAEGDLFVEDEKLGDRYTLAGLKGTANFTDLTVQVEDIRLTAVQPLIVEFSTNQVTFTRTQFTGTNTNVLFGGTLALAPGVAQSLTVDGKIDLRILKGLSPDLFLNGSAEANVRVAGTYEEPRINGTASLNNASMSVLIADERLTISNVKGGVRFNNNQAQIDSLTGVLGGGRVSVTGGALISGLALSRFQFNVRGDDVTVPYPENFRSTADVDLDFRGTATRGQQIATVISGSINLRRAEYTEDILLEDLINRRREALIEQGGEFALAATAQFQDLRIEGRDALIIRNNLAETVGSVSLRVNGPVKEPIVAGRITATTGTITFRNKRYEIQRATIDLPGQLDADPIINIQAEAEVQGYDVIVAINGPLTQPSVNVRSDPALPQADVVSLILNGELATGETGTSALAQSGLGTAASLLTESLISAPARRATDKLFGLNRFEIDPLIAGRGGESPTARLTVGRQINKNLSITYSTNVTGNQNQVLAVEYRVSNRLSFVAQYEQGSTTGFSSRNDNFSFEIRLRKRF